MASFAIAEIAKIGILKAEDVEDSHVVHVPKTYPAYFGSYDRFDVIRNYLDRFENLFLVGRNGMHKYNNQDHSMLTAMTAVENIVNGVTHQRQYLGHQHRDGVSRRKGGEINLAALLPFPNSISMFALENGTRHVAQHGRTGKRDGAVPCRNEKSAGRVRRSAGIHTVMVFERCFYFTQRVRLLLGGLALPVQRKSLSANSAADLCPLVAALAQNLHVPGFPEIFLLKKQRM